MRPLPSILVHGMVAAAVSGVALLCYDRLATPEPLSIGVVDLNSVYRDHEAEFARGITGAGTDLERERTLQSARDFARVLPDALESLPRECGCVVLLSSAVLTPAPNAIDLTPALRQKIDRALRSGTGE